MVRAGLRQGLNNLTEDYMDYLSLLVSSASMVVAIFSLYFTIQLWRKSNRPLVTARVSTHSGGNVNIALDILVENSGTRPALDVRLEAREEQVRAAMAAPDAGAPIPRDAQRIFFSDVVIPVLPNGRTTSNAFGATGQDGEWRPGARIPIMLTYRSLDGARYVEAGELLLFDDGGFAQTSWGNPSEREISHHIVRISKQAGA